MQMPARNTRHLPGTSDFRQRKARAEDGHKCNHIGCKTTRLYMDSTRNYDGKQGENISSTFTSNRIESNIDGKQLIISICLFICFA